MSQVIVLLQNIYMLFPHKNACFIGISNWRKRAIIAKKIYLNFRLKFKEHNYYRTLSVSSGLSTIRDE